MGKPGVPARVCSNRVKGSRGPALLALLTNLAAARLVPFLPLPLASVSFSLANPVGPKSENLAAFLLRKTLDPLCATCGHWYWTLISTL